jgi:hypothetical protein
MRMGVCPTCGAWDYEGGMCGRCRTVIPEQQPGPRSVSAGPSVAVKPARDWRHELTKPRLTGKTARGAGAEAPAAQPKQPLPATVVTVLLFSILAITLGGWAAYSAWHLIHWTAVVSYVVTVLCVLVNLNRMFGKR